jgi:hypothetical protein
MTRCAREVVDIGARDARIERVRARKECAKRERANNSQA